MEKALNGVSDKSVLIVTPDDNTARLVSGALHKHGISRVKRSRDVAEALAQIEEEIPDLVISGVHMPEMDGWQLCRILKSEENSRFNDIPILLLSDSYRDGNAVRLAEEVGAFALLQMPFDEDDLALLVMSKLAPELVDEERIRSVSPRREVMIVDDDANLLKALSFTLENAGFSVSLASDGETAVQMMKKSKPTVLLLDYRMPGMDGMEVLNWVRENCPDTMVIVMTAHGDEMLAVDIMRAGAFDYIKKPFALSDLTALCEKALHVLNMRLIHRQFGERVAELRISERKFKALFESAGDGIVISDPQTGRIIDANERFCGMFSLTREELPRMRFEQLFGVPARSGALQNIRCRTAKGDEIFVDISSTIVHYDTGEVVQSIVRDITQRRKLEIELAEKAKQLQAQNIRLKEVDRLKSEFLNMVSHELRTPLTSIEWSLDSLKAFLEGNDNPKVEQLLQILHADVGRLSHLINQLLDFSRIEAGKLALSKVPLDVGKIVNDAIAEIAHLAREKSADIKTEIPTNLPRISADRERLLQVLTNLLSNSLKYCTSKPQIIVSARRVDDAVEISVADNGIGIAEEDLKKVFDRFYRVPRSEVSGQAGTGLGLSIAKSIVEAHGGSIRAESEPNKGSTFRFTIPFA